MDDAIEARRRDPRYQRLMAATREAARAGYDAVSMRDLAEATRMSLQTVYQFCSSKDHLIAEAHLEVMADFRSSLAVGKRKGRTPEERVRQVVRGIVNGLEHDEVLTRTLMRAIYSFDRDAAAMGRPVAATYREMVDAAIGDDDIPDRDDVIETLGRVIDSAVYGWLARGDDVATVRNVLDRTVRLLFSPRAP
jgi:TetR/AcrR family transcriptional regulator, cholesterol catabolism regulator